MKKNIYISLLLWTCAATLSFAQEAAPCNRTVHASSFNSRLPKGICLPVGYKIRAILSDTTDIDRDGKVDFTVKLQKINVQDGDTTLVVLYKQNEEGSFEEWVTFDNLFPIYLKDYYFDYYRDHKDTSYFMKLRQRYSAPEHSDVLFEKDTIIVKFNTSAGTGLLLYFNLNEKRNDWNLVKQSIWDGSVRTGEIEEIPNYGIIIPKNQYSIREFNMLDYLDE